MIRTSIFLLTSFLRLALLISFDDVYGAAVDEKHLHVFRIFALVPVSAKKREEKQYAFKCTSIQIAAQAVDVIKHVLAGVPLQGLLTHIRTRNEATNALHH